MSLGLAPPRAARIAAAEEGRRKNVELFTNKFLGLGPDAAKLSAPSHQEELIEAAGLAAHRWARFLDLEAEAVKHPELQDEADRERKELEGFIPAKKSNRR